MTFRILLAVCFLREEVFCLPVSLFVSHSVRAGAEEERTRRFRHRVGFSSPALGVVRVLCVPILGDGHHRCLSWYRIASAAFCDRSMVQDKRRQISLKLPTLFLPVSASINRVSARAKWYRTNRRRINLSLY